jgi:hypothetical protein
MCELRQFRFFTEGVLFCKKRLLLSVKIFKTMIGQSKIAAFAARRGQTEKQFFIDIAVAMYAKELFTFQEAADFCEADDFYMLHYLGMRSVPVRWEELHASRPKKKGKAGGVTVYYMAEDFDAPLEDFADYM